MYVFFSSFATMKSVTALVLFLFVLGIEGGNSDDTFAHFFYDDLGCTKKDGQTVHYECPDFSPKNGTCVFKNKILKVGDEVDKELLKGSCQALCVCTDRGINCAHYDCFQRLKPGCSHFKSSLDGCCPVGSICEEPIAECKVDGETYKEGQKMYIKGTCDVCVCDKGFKKEAPFCRTRKCYDQTYHEHEITNYGAPVFFKDSICCPNTWTYDEADKIIKINADAPSDSNVSCQYGKQKVQLGHGFEKSVQPYGRLVPLICECTIPPFVTCKEKL